MNDVLLEKLKQRNVSADEDKTKERIQEIWQKADKKSKKALLDFAGKAIYNAIGKTTKNGRITSKMAIIISQNLNVNPLYLIGSSDERGEYNDENLRQFLNKLGYAKLWREYEKYAKTTEASDKDDVITEEIKILEQTETEIKDIINETVIEDANELKTEEKPTNVTASIAKSGDISPEVLNVMNNLTEEEIITLVKALVIKSKIKSADAYELLDQVKLLLLLN